VAENTFLDVVGRRVVVADGAMGTQLQAHDLSLDDFAGLEGCNEILNVTRPDVVRSVHRGFLEVGSDLIETNTFGANWANLAEYDIPDRIYELAEAGARLARETADEFTTAEWPRFVLGAIGPGTKLPTLGHVTYAHIRDAYIEQVRGDSYRVGDDWVELGVMSTGSFCEPLAFSRRAERFLRTEGAGRFDVIHDNQCLGTGILRIAQRQPVVATIHHPITVDKRLEMAEAGWWRKIGLSRWYSFIKMQMKVARQLPKVITVSETSRKDLIEEIGIDPGRIDVVPVGTDPEVFRPRPDVATVPGRILAVVSSDVPLKGLSFLVEAVAKLRTEVPHAHLVVIGRQRKKDPGHRLVAKFGLEGAVTFTGSIPFERLLELYGEAEVAAVPSLYEGFSLPSIQAMASKIPLVCTRAGAIPEVAGTDGETALLVEPGDAAALAAALKRLLTEPELAARLAEAAYTRALDRFTWKAMARGTVDQYHTLIDSHSNAHA
jgi:glycosyltransferase involved in cell wall biosynthesis